jgi:glycosyltransferase involved in cell wall biosynthesis
MNFPLFLNPVWIGVMWRVARAVRVDRIIVCDLPLAPTALFVGRRLRTPVHFDMGEVYPLFLRSIRECGAQRPLDIVVRNARAAAWLERGVLREAARIYVVSEESRVRAVRLGANPENVIIVGNTPETPSSLSAAAPRPADLPVQAPHRFILLFVGVLIFDRGVELAVQALAKLVAEGRDVHLVVVGDGPERGSVLRCASNLGLDERVHLVGWREPDDLSGYYQNADVGLLPFRATSHIKVTLANKLFDYMAAALPIVAVDVPPMRRVLASTPAGLLFQPEDVADLARCVAELLDDDLARRAAGRAGQRAVAGDGPLSWRHDAQRFLTAVESKS